MFGLAALILYGSPRMLAIKLFHNACICIGLVGLSVGMGAYFAEFEWTHSSELTTGFGSLVYMLISVLLIAFNLVLGAGVLL